MSLTDYAVKTLALRAEFRASNRGLAVLFEIGRGAAGTALVLVIADFAGFPIFAAEPKARVFFIVGSAVLMPLVEAIRVSAIGPQRV